MTKSQNHIAKKECDFCILLKEKLLAGSELLAEN